MTETRFASRLLATAIATLLVGTPLAPRRAAAQEVIELPEYVDEDFGAIGDEVLPPEVSPDQRLRPTEEAPTDATSISLPTGDTRTAVNPQAISLPTAEGSIEGMGESFTPHLSSGTGSFSVPIAVAPGRAGVQPSFALAYSTSGGNGAAGFGWNLSAPFISRQSDRGVPRYQDQALWHPAEDRFIYNGGQELVPVDSTAMGRVDGQANGGVSPGVPSGMAGWQEYRARVEGGFMRFFREPRAGANRWVVFAKDGSRFDFGLVPAGEGPSEMVTGSTLALERDPAAPSRVYRWMLTRMVDAHGSPVWYRYTQQDGQAYLQDVTYVSPITGTCTPSTPDVNRACSAPLSSFGARVAFQYESRTDVFDTWVSGWRVASPLRLGRVVVTAWDDTLGERALVRRYHLSYSATSFHSQLASVQVEGRPDALDTWGVHVMGAPVPESTLGTTGTVGRRLPPMRFSYTELPAGLDNAVHPVANSPPHSIDESRSELFDVNSDGLPDLVVTDPARYRTTSGAPATGVFFNGFSGASATPAGRTAAFSEAVPVAMPPGRDSSMSWSNANIAPMDIDGDGRSDLLHMPRIATYGWYTPARFVSDPDLVSPRAQDWRWAYAEIGLPTSDADPRIDLGRDGAHIQVLDVNNDHLIDVVRTTGTEIQTWLNLGWLPEGDGRFGSYSWSGSTPVLSTQPVSSCLPTAGTVFDFEDPEARLGDMNGDGLQDLVRVRRGRVIYWPGRGDGSFGVGARGCAPGITADRHIEMTSPPNEPIELSAISLADVDADGADDVIQVRFDAIDVWFNRAGRSFTPRTIVSGTPANPSFSNRVRLTDVDGSGTLDVLYAEARNWRFVDLAGGQRPRLLIGVENGLGAQTTLEYGTSAQDYVRDLAACAAETGDCFPWSQEADGPSQHLAEHALVDAYRPAGSPVISTVVRAVSTTDRMSVLGLEDQVSRQELAYHDGYYEGIEQEFRGFGATDSHSIGDWNNPTTITRTWFHQGRRPQSIADDRLAHNPDESLKGREYLTETLDEAGNYLASAHATIAVRRLALGQDGRPIDYAFVTAADELRYDTTPFEPGTDVATMADVTYETVSATNGAISAWPSMAPRTRDVPVRGVTARAARIRTEFHEIDNLGHVHRQVAVGRVSVLLGGSPADVPIVSHTDTTLIAPWMWRTARTWTDGPSGPLGDTTVTFTATGDPRKSRTTVSGTPPLEFAGEAAIEGGAIAVPPGTFRDPDAPADAEEPVVASVHHDRWGQPLAQCAGGDLGTGAVPTSPPTSCLRYGAVAYDPQFGQLATRETAWVGSGTTDTLVTTGQWDRGLGALLSATAPNGETSRIRYDGFGRPVASIPPPVQACEANADLPSATIDYQLTSDPGTRPLSRVVTTTIMRDATTCASAPSIVGVGYVDGLGRPRAALSTGSDGHAWVRAGITTFDRKGSVRRTYQPTFYEGTPDDFAAIVALPSDIPYAVTRYDAFGRARGVIAEDGSTVWTSHHALSTDVCDPLDNDSTSPHFRTCTTARVDGHGRVIDQMLRNRHPDTGTLEHHRLWTWYRQDGAVVALVRTQRLDSVTRPDTVPSRDVDTVVRTFTYDSIGRRVTSADPDTDSRSPARTSENKSWRYRFNRVGDLVAVRDPRGCGQNFFYDLGGRLLGEQYVSCAEAQTSAAERPIATLPSTWVGTARSTGALFVDVRYHYDSYAEITDWVVPPSNLTPSTVPLRTAGLATGVEDRGQRSAVAYDRRGNAAWSAREMAVISDAVAMQPATVRENGDAISANDSRPHFSDITPAQGTIVYDHAPLHTYVRTAQFDHAGRGVAITLPMDPDFGTGVPTIRGTMTFDSRGLPETATAHVDSAAYPIVRGMRYTRDGLVERVDWGDPRTPAAATESVTFSETRYDTRRRPIRMYTERLPTAGAEIRTLGDVSAVVDQELVWDSASNLTDIVDHRDGSEWPEGFRPRTTHVEHDSLYRVVGAFFEYTQENNSRTTVDTAVDYRHAFQSLTDPNNDGEYDDSVDPMATVPAPMVPAMPGERAVSLTWSWDFLGNSTEWTDDQHSFYERSIGEIENGLENTTDRPSALYLSTNIDAPLTSQDDSAGWLEVDYGEGGNVIAMTVHGRCGPVATACTAGSSADHASRRDSLRNTCACATEQHYQYRWDELNRLSEARRWDRESGGAWNPEVRQRSRYDGANVRTLKQTFEPSSEQGGPVAASLFERITLFVIPSDFERRGLARTLDSYVPTSWGAEAQYLVAGARLVWRDVAAPAQQHASNRRMTVPLTDIIQSATATLDVLNGDLIEASAYYPNGAMESLATEADDPSATEPAGFTGKEADGEVGLTYFGERFLIAQLGRWASPDPLSVHVAGGGEVGNSYHYISGNLLQGRDPVGLQDGEDDDTEPAEGSGGSADRSSPQTEDDEPATGAPEPPADLVADLQSRLQRALADGSGRLRFALATEVLVRARALRASGTAESSISFDREFRVPGVGVPVRFRVRGALSVNHRGEVQFSASASFSVEGRWQLAPHAAVAQRLAGLFGASSEAGPSVVLQFEVGGSYSLRINLDGTEMRDSFSATGSARLGLDFGVGLQADSVGRTGAYARVGIGVIGQVGLQFGFGQPLSVRYSLSSYAQHEEGFRIGGWRMSNRTRFSYHISGTASVDDLLSSGEPRREGEVPHYQAQ